MTSYAVVYGTILDKKALQHISAPILERIHRSIEEKLTTDPRAFGKPLRKSLKGCWGLRVGDYRVIYRIVGQTVEIFAIEHRSLVYVHLERKFRSVLPS